MTAHTTTNSTAASTPTQPVLLPEQVAHLPEDWRTASADKLLVLQRIAAQRVRLQAAKQARLQAKALKSSQPQVMPPADAPLPERAKAFVRLHPVATAVAAGALLFVGPRRLIRMARWVSPVLPVLVNWRK